MNKGLNESISQIYGRMCDGLNILILKGKGNYSMHLQVCDLNQYYPSEIPKMMEMFYIMLFIKVSINHIQLLGTWNVTSVPEEPNF